MNSLARRFTWWARGGGAGNRRKLCIEAMHSALPWLLYLTDLDEPIGEEEGGLKVIILGQKPTKELMIGAT